jgi:hypothetical protein
MCRVTAYAIQFETTEAASKEHIKIVMEWIALANSQAKKMRSQNQRLEAKQRDIQDLEKKRQALQEKLNQGP